MKETAMESALHSAISQSNDSGPVDVCGKRTRDYFLESLARMNRNKGRKVSIRAIGGNISKGVGLAEILRRELRVAITRTEIHPLTIDRERSSCLEIDLEGHGTATQGTADPSALVLSDGFVPYPAYSLLFDALLDEHASIDISAWTSDTPLCRLRRTSNSFSMTSSVDIRDNEKKGKVLDALRDASYRAGLLVSPHWKSVAEALSRYDDVILCADTNILRSAVLTSQLLASLSLIDPREYTHTPNWLMIVVPNAVIHELEQVANNRRSGDGLLTEKGRLGYRALQEVLELNNSLDLSGVSLTIVGSASPVMDTKEELRGLRQDLARGADGKDDDGSDGDELKTRSPKRSSGDMIIRAQFKEFLREIDFHKGVFFLTADKSCAALARAEGLHPIYYSNPPRALVAKTTVTEATLKCSSRLGDVTLGVSIGSFIYELAVQFGTLTLRWGDKGPKHSVNIHADQRGESLDPWLQRYLKVVGIESLMETYGSKPRVSLDEVDRVWNSVLERLLDSDA